MFIYIGEIELSDSPANSALEGLVDVTDFVV